MANYSDIVVVIPSLNPDEKLMGVIRGLAEAGFDDIVVINDGSDPATLCYFPGKAEDPPCTLLTHPVNRGKGAGLKTAFRYIRENRPHCLGVVTVDGDGQHCPADIARCADALRAHPDSLILGVRDFSLPQVPKRSRAGNRITSLVFRVGVGLKISDTQTGLRAIPRDALPAMEEVRGDRYEYETNMLLSLKRYGIPYREVPIETVYIDGNQTSHFHPVRDSLRIYRLILAYLFSSLSSSLLDLGLFALLSWLMPDIPHSVMVCTVLARVVSSLYNYFVNCRVVFAARENGKGTFLRYYLLAAAVMLVSGGAVSLLSLAFGTQTSLLRTVLKLIVDTLLFLASFRIQQNWVFGK